MHENYFILQHVDPFSSFRPGNLKVVVAPCLKALPDPGSTTGCYHFSGNNDFILFHVSIASRNENKYPLLRGNRFLIQTLFFPLLQLLIIVTDLIDSC